MRNPLPLFSASLPSGLKMRRPNSARCEGASARMPSEPTPRWRSQMSRTAAGVRGKVSERGSRTM